MPPVSKNTTAATEPSTETLHQRAYDLRFVATDGYISSGPFEALQNGKGIVAFRDVDAPKGAQWKEFKLGKSTTTPKPFFLVWEGIPYTEKLYPWPFQLARIELIERGAAPEGTKPKSTDPKVLAGFAQFRSQCLVCHSINLLGAELGPELNVPKNITEYRTFDYFRAFVRNPGSFRARSKMTPQTIADQDLEQVWAYLMHMKNEKVCDTPAKCESL